MIQFFVPGTPVAQGSMTPFTPVSPNADIDEAIEHLRSQATDDRDNGYDHDADNLEDLADSLAAIGKWPAYQKHGPDAKTPGHFVATMRASNATALNKWRDKIAEAARYEYAGPPMYGPVRVQMTFTFVRPQNHWGTGRNARILKPWAPKYHANEPDIDKLTRAVLDALTQSGVIIDDKIVAEDPGVKLWSDTKDGGEGVAICVSSLLSGESKACRSRLLKIEQGRLSDGR